MRNTTSQIRFNTAAVRLGRKRKGLTQEQLARELGVTNRTVQHWEQGAEPNAANFLRLAELLDLSPDELYEAAA